MLVENVVNHYIPLLDKDNNIPVIYADGRLYVTENSVLKVLTECTSTYGVHVHYDVKTIGVSIYEVDTERLCRTLEKFGIIVHPGVYLYDLQHIITFVTAFLYSIDHHPSNIYQQFKFIQSYYKNILTADGQIITPITQVSYEVKPFFC